MYSIKDAQEVAKTIAEKLQQDLDLFAKLDGLSGDGDLGETMGKCAGVLLSVGQNEEYETFGQFFMKTASAMNKAAPSTLGTLLSGGVMQLAKTHKEKITLTASEVAEIPGVVAEGIQLRGKAKLGDKTILDALIPMGQAAKTGFIDTNDLKKAFQLAGQAAVQGAQSTCGMVPKAGRAQWIGERVKDNMDGGAAVCASVAELFV